VRRPRGFASWPDAKRREGHDAKVRICLANCHGPVKGGIEGASRNWPSSLAGGQFQRVAKGLPLSGK